MRLSIAIGIVFLVSGCAKEGPLRPTPTPFVPKIPHIYRPPPPDPCQGFVEGRACFDSDWWRATNGQCRPGLWECHDGYISCVGQIAPEAEVCGDGIDNDCDGYTDNGFSLPAMEVVVVIDNSGSMRSRFVSVVCAISRILLSLETYGLRVALVSGSSYVDNTHVEVLTDFTTAENAIQILNNLQSNGYSIEHMLDATYWAANEGTHLGLSWLTPPEARAVLVFSDETPYGEYAVPGSFWGTTTPVFAWSLDPREWYTVTNATRGWAFQLTESCDYTAEQANAVVQRSCSLSLPAN